MAIGKRVFILLFCAISLDAFCEKISIGAGVGWDPHWNTLKQTQGSAWVSSMDSSASCIDGFAFLDAGYLQLGIGYLGTGPKYSNDITSSNRYTNHRDFSNGFCGGWIYGSALIEIPFRGKSFSFSPQVGVEYDYNLSYTDAGGNDIRGSMSTQEKIDLNQFWFEFGAAGDFLLSESVFLRLSIMGGYKFLNDDDTAYADSISIRNADVVDLVFFRLSTSMAIAFKLL